MSCHSLEGEEGTYAGVAHIGGVEELERGDFKKLSKAFNHRVYEGPPPLPPPHYQADEDEGGFTAVSDEGGFPAVSDESPLSHYLSPPPALDQTRAGTPPVLNAQGYVDKDRVIQDLEAGPVLLALRPASGKTRLIVDLMHPARMLLIVVPNLALQQQVCVRHECSSVRCINAYFVSFRSWMTSRHTKEGSRCRVSKATTHGDKTRAVLLPRIWQLLN
jgi:hypothetical protein